MPDDDAGWSAGDDDSGSEGDSFVTAADDSGSSSSSNASIKAQEQKMMMMMMLEEEGGGELQEEGEEGSSSRATVTSGDDDGEHDGGGADEDEEEELTPLTEAVCCGDVEVVESLLQQQLQRGGELWTMVNERGGDGGQTPLMLAAEMGSEEMVELLLEAGADASLVSSGGWTALMLASMHGHVGVVRRLLREQRRQQDVNARDCMGETAFWKACCVGAVAVAEVLLFEGGADHTIPAVGNGSPVGGGSCWMAPWQVARQNGHWEVDQLLEWWEEEMVERPYVLQKARYVREAHSMPPILVGPLAQRLAAGLPLPALQLLTMMAGGQGGQHMEQQPEEAMEEEMMATIDYVTGGDLNTQLYVELMAGLELPEPATPTAISNTTTAAAAAAAAAAPTEMAAVASTTTIATITTTTITTITTTVDC